MNRLFEQSNINSMTLPNRFVRSATWEGMAAENGQCTPKLIDLMSSLAKGGVGMIITSHTYVRPDGQAGPWQLGIYSDDLIPALEAMTRAVHKNNGTIVMQLAHAGLFAAAKLTGQMPIAPSNVDGLAESAHREMTVRDIREVAQAFAAGAQRARRAGFDGVQIHAAHGYLLSQFLSPIFNHRRDNYGGDINNRARALLEVVQSIRAAVGKDYPVLVKMNCRDFAENGLTLEDSVQVGVMLAEAGADAIEVSGGNRLSGKLGAVRLGIHSEDQEAYFQNEATAFKEKVTVPLILVGGNRSFHVAERLLNAGAADYISMCRPLIREPDLINRWKSGDRQRAACVSDNLCYGPARKGDGIYCVTEEREMRKGRE